MAPLLYYLLRATTVSNNNSPPGGFTINFNHAKIEDDPGGMPIVGNFSTSVYLDTNCVGKVDMSQLGNFGTRIFRARIVPPAAPLKARETINHTRFARKYLPFSV